MSTAQYTLNLGLESSDMDLVLEYLRGIMDLIHKGVIPVTTKKPTIELEISDGAERHDTDKDATVSIQKREALAKKIMAMNLPIVKLRGDHEGRIIADEELRERCPDTYDWLVNNDQRGKGQEQHSQLHKIPPVHLDCRINGNIVSDKDVLPIMHGWMKGDDDASYSGGVKLPSDGNGNIVITDELRQNHPDIVEWLEEDDGY